MGRGVAARPARPELLSPAGDWDCLRAAVENGADAVYFGLDVGFNARHRAHNFPPADLPEILDYLHSRGVRGYVTVNTLVFPGELEEFERLARTLAAAGVDAVIVQDLGAVRLLRRLCPELPVHASTQMTMTSAQNIELLQSLGVERVILARELSVAEIAQIGRQTSMPLETFVHGALCVAYSGQCLTSESLGGRSANRGQCAQACRLPYELIRDGRPVDLGEMHYLLSPQDLAGYEQIPDLIAAGVCSLKIEGRLKTPEYVASITRTYREAIDQALTHGRVTLTPEQVEEMQLTFSRGFSPGWLRGCDHKALVPGRTSTKRGILLGEVEAVARQRLRVRLQSSVKPGDGLVIDTGGPQDDEQGGRVYELFIDGRPAERAAAEDLVELAFGRKDVDLRRVCVGHRLWKTDDPELARRLRATYTGSTLDASARQGRRVSLALQVTAVVGQPLVVEAQAESGAAVRVASDRPLEPALRHRLTIDVLREQFGRLGQTIYTLGELVADIQGDPMVPLSVLGQLRRALIEQLSQNRRRAYACEDASVVQSLREELRSSSDGAAPNETEAAGRSRSAAAPQLWALCRNQAQLEALASAGVDGLYADFHDIREHRRAVEAARAAGCAIWLATPRIQKPSEMGIFRLIERYQPDGVLVRNLAGLLHFTRQGWATAADFSLNAANELTAGLLCELGAERITASYDLNREQLLELASAALPQRLEVVLHQHMPMFHMEHCVFCAAISPGTDKTNCGRPCDRHEVKLRDRIGVEHPLQADVGCRNTLFNAVPQSGAEAAPQLLAAGCRTFRVELLEESPSQARRLVELYQRLLAGRISGRDVWSQLSADNRVGVTRGALEPRRNPLAILQ